MSLQPDWLLRALAPAAAPVPPPLLVAVSGGGDSMALLRGLLAAGWSAADLVVGHVDHGVRAGSDEDAAFVAAQAARLGVRCYTERLTWSVAANADDLRQARRAALTAFADAVGAAGIALAHTADDQRETKWLAMIRGSGLDGLVGMAPWRPPWWRPLLHLPRAALRAWALAVRVPWRDDPTNTDTTHMRARLRHVVLPAVARPLGPHDVLRDRILRDDLAWLEGATRQAAAAVVDGQGVLERAAFMALDVALQRRVLRLWLGSTLAERIEAVRLELLRAAGSRLRTIECGGGRSVYVGTKVATHDVGLPHTPRKLADTALPWGRLGLLEVRGCVEVATLAAWRRSGDVAEAANRSLAQGGIAAPLRALWPVVRTNHTTWWPRPGTTAAAADFYWEGGWLRWHFGFDALC